MTEEITFLQRSLAAIVKERETFDDQLRINHAATVAQPFIDRALAAIPNPTYLQREAIETHFFCTTAMDDNYKRHLWDGSALQGRTLLVCSDQGFGDALQLYRFLPTADNVILACQKPLMKLFEGPRVVDKSQPAPPYDVHCSLVSLPYLTGARDFPPLPYLHVPYKPLGGGIGIVWAGDPFHYNDHNRSMRLRTMLEFLPHGRDYVSLKVQFHDEDRETMRERGNVIDLSPILNDFYDTAMIVNQLDLVISVDTSVAHLAGALGKPVWILLPSEGLDVRWGTEGTRTPWYPTARLFRQERAGDWSGVGRQIRAALS